MPSAEVLTPHLLRGWPLPLPDDSGSKHDRGTVLVVGGAVSTPGAVLLAGLAALRAGAGRLQVATVHETAVQLGIALPEAMVDGHPSDPSGSLAPGCELDLRCDALLLGPGLLAGQAARSLLEEVVPAARECALVLDAVALHCLADLPDLLLDRPSPAVLTPNAGELDHLGGSAQDVAARYGAVVATHGLIVHPDGRQWVNETGSVGLGTSGSGDVQAGLVLGLLGRGASPEQAAAWGQYVHATAGDRLVITRGRVGFLARELLDEVPSAMATLTA